MKKQKYDIGKLINNEWAIVSILEVKNQNKKILCYNINTNSFIEGWIWDFTRGLILTSKKSRNQMCYITNKINTFDYTRNLDAHFEYSDIVYFDCNYLTRDEYSYLRDIREGSYSNLQHILKRFDYCLATSGQARRNQRLAMLISTTYKILSDRDYWKVKEKRAL